MRVLDLTHAFDNGMPVFPGLPDPSFEHIAQVEQDGYAMTRYSMLNHIGTHVDAPAHQIAGGDTLDEIGLDRLVTDAVRIDVSGRDPHGPIPLAELQPELERVRAGDIVLSTPTTPATTAATRTGPAGRTPTPTPRAR